MNSIMRHLRSFSPLKCWTSLAIIQVHLKGVEREVVTHPDLGIEGPPMDGNSGKIVTESLPLIIV